MGLKIEIRRLPDRRLLVVVHFVEDSNFWIHSNRTVSYVPKRSEIELMKESLDAIDNHNLENTLMRNLRKED